MDLYLIRHADALPLGVQGITEDGARPLSDEGRAQAKALGEALSAKGVRLDKIVTSPLVRARRTADGLLAAWSESTPDLVVCEELAPGGKRRRLARFLRQLGGTAVGLVGHQPDLGRLAGWLIGSKKAQVNIAKAGVAHIACDDALSKGAGALVCLVTLEWLGALPVTTTKA
jgi:phosphohistidine phosphatase